MSTSDRIPQLLASLANEIRSTAVGSTQGQFPLLDLFGNLRDEGAGREGMAEFQSCCAVAWERMIPIVESGEGFTSDQLSWLQGVLDSLQALLQPGGAAGGTGAEPAATAAMVVDVPSVVPPPAPPPSEAAGTVTEEAPLNLNLADDRDLLREFIAESREHLDNIEQGMLVLERQPTDAETLNTVFRAFHTFKGGAGFLNLLPINRLAHVLESLLDQARQGRLTIDGEVIELILRGRDVLKQFLDEIDGQLGGGRPCSPICIPTGALKADVQAAIDQATGGGRPAPSSSGVPAAAPAAAPAPVPTVESEKVEDAVGSAVATGEAVAAGGSGVSTSAGAGAGGGAARASEQGAMVKVDTGKLDVLLDLVGEMVITQSLVGQDPSLLANADPQFARNMAQLGRITKDLQRVSMSLRMVPIRGAFQKMARVVRDISAKQGKQVLFRTSGDDTELDRGVVEQLNDPLLHMIRNSMDHGIEGPDKRIAAGKTPVGTLHLRAFHQGGNILVEIEDDGAGLSRERILKKAIERGIASPNDKRTDEEVYGFIFAPGFSTAEKITDLSGRGVGLDVVRRNVEQLRGRVDVSSTPGKGTLFKLTLPLTLAIIDGLIVRCGRERYIIPTLSVRESFRPQPGTITRVQGRAEVVMVRGRLIPLLRLADFFGIDSGSSDPEQGIVVVVQSGASVRCLLVDDLLHKQEVVIKNLNEMMVHKNRALAGATILGDGRVGLILDVNAVVHLEHRS